MTTIAFEAAGREKSAWHPDFSALSQVWQRLAARLAQRHAMRQLSGIEPRLLRDMGIEPAAVYGDIPGLGDLHASLLSGPAMRRGLRQ